MRCSGNSAAPSPPATARTSRRARAVPDIEMMDRLTEAEPLGMSLYRPLEAAPSALRFKLFRAGEPVDAVGQPADARAHGDEGARRAPAPDRAGRTRRRSGCTTSACSRTTATPRSRSTRCTRCSRTRSAASSAARSRTTTSTAWCVAARLPATEVVGAARLRASTCGRSASRCRRRSSRQRWRRMRDIAADAGHAVQAALRSGSAVG